jgi:hypothetical protein
MLLIFKVLAQLQMCNGVRCDQVFKSENVFQEVFAYDQVSAPNSRSTNVIKDALKDFNEECAGAASEV